MRARKRYIPVSSATPGMVLGHRAIAPEHGVLRLSLPAGQVLDGDIIDQLLKHRCEFICIEEDDERSDEEYQAETEQQEQRLKHIFSPAGLGDPTVNAFYQAVLAYRRS